MHNNFEKWLQLSGEPQSIKRFSTDTEELVIPSDLETADRMWRDIGMLREDGESQLAKPVTIWFNGRMYGSSLHIASWDQNTFPGESAMLSTDITLSTWVKQNPEIFKAMPGNALVYSGDRDTGFRCLAAKYDISEKQLNKPIAQLLGNPLSTWEPQIAQPRQARIEELLATGQTQVYGYENIYVGRRWQFKSTVLSLPVGDEILVLVEDAKGWQREYWENSVED